jgi:DNA-binding NtrC family response regulator
MIDVVSNRNSGSSFNLYLPVPQQTEKSSEVEDENDETILGGSETILVIEDERDYLELLQNLIEEKGYTILTATNGRSGLDLFLNNQKKIDLLLCDLDLPEIRGVDVLNRIWANNPSVKAILMSGYINPQMRSQFSNDRIYHVLEKPLKPHILFKTIRHLLDLPKK